MFLFGLLVACQSEDNSGFSTNGTDTVNPSSIVTGSDDDGSGTASNGDLNGVNPIVSGLDAFFIDLEGDTFVEVHVFVDDAQDDLMNGALEVDYTWGDQTASMELSIDGDSVLVETGELTFLISDVDSGSTYEIFVTVYDEAGNPSEPVSGEVSPVE